MCIRDSTTNLTSIADISCGEDFSYFLISDGTVYASGEGSVGEQGDGANSDNTSASICTGLSGIVDILGTQACGFARKSDGTLYVWGDNTAGQFASGSASSGDTHTPTEITSITGVEEISAYSRGETLIARKSDGSVFCWGEGTTGSIGNGLSSSVSSPTQPIPGAGPSVDGKFNLLTDPKLDFDGFNKLTIENITQTSSTITYPNDSTVNTNTVSDVYIKDIGEYALEASDANTFVTSNVYVSALDTVGAANPPTLNFDGYNKLSIDNVSIKHVWPSTITNTNGYWGVTENLHYDLDSGASDSTNICLLYTSDAADE